MAEHAIITASAPGSLMLLGEHAVLHGKRALVCAINRRITVSLSPRDSKTVCIESALGQYECPLNNLVDDAAMRFVVQAVRQHADVLPSGFQLGIESEFSAEIGFGSSAAVTVATHAVLSRFAGRPMTPETLFAEALKSVHAVQGRGSGADLAASVFGGIVAYSTAPSFNPVPMSIPLTAVYCGYKTPTPEVIQHVEALQLAEPSKYARIYAEMDADAGQAVERLRAHDLPGLGQILNRNQRWMDEMGVNTPELQEIVDALQARPDIFGAKISGSGLGDCVIGLGHAALEDLGYPVYHLEITPNGCAYHD